MKGGKAGGRVTADRKGVCLALRVPGPWQLGCHVGWEGEALSPREQAGFGGSRLCLHLPPTPSPRSPLIPRALPPLGSAQSAHLQLLLQKVAALSLALLHRSCLGLRPPLPQPTLSHHRCRTGVGVKPMVGVDPVTPRS